MAQFAVPISDLDNTGGWTTTPLWSKINEGGGGDGTVVVSDTTPVVTEPFTVDLFTISDPSVATGHILRIRWAKNASGGGPKTIRIELREGYVNESTLGTLIATDDYSINSTTLRTDATTLASGEANSITDYSDLQIRVMGVAGNRALQVDFVELEAPDAAQTINIGTLAETNALVGVNAEKEASIGTLAEVESLVPANAEKEASIGTLAESEVLNPVEAIKEAQIGTLAEGNTLNPVEALKPIFQPVGTLTETDTLNPIPVEKVADIGTLAELETLLSIQARKLASIGTLAELDILIPAAVVMGGGQDIAVTTLGEINSLVGAQAIKEAIIGTIGELESLIPVEALKPIFVTVGTLGEINPLISLGISKIADIGTLAELETLIAVEGLKSVLVGTLAELETLIAVVAVVVGRGWWNKDLVVFVKDPAGFTKTPVSFTKRKPGDP